MKGRILSNWCPACVFNGNHVERKLSPRDARAVRQAATRKAIERSEAHPAFRDLPIRTGRLK